MNQNKVWNNIAEKWSNFRQKPEKTAVELSEVWEPGKILDVGCGNCRNLLPFSKFDCYGVDFSENMIKEAEKFVSKKNMKVTLKVGDVTKIPFKDESFDLIIVSEVLEHLENDAKGISEVYRILRPSGLAFFSVPHANYPFFWDPINWVLERFMGTHIKSGFWAGFWNNHLRLYSQSLLTSKLKSSKFKSIETQILTSYCLPFNHHLLNLAARFLVNRKNSSIRRVVSKFNTNSKDGMLTVNPYGLFFWIDQLNNRTYGEIGVSLVSSVKK